MSSYLILAVLFDFVHYKFLVLRLQHWGSYPNRHTGMMPRYKPYLLDIGNLAVFYSSLPHHVHPHNVWYRHKPDSYRYIHLYDIEIDLNDKKMDILFHQRHPDNHFASHICGINVFIYNLAI